MGSQQIVEITLLRRIDDVGFSHDLKDQDLHCLLALAIRVNNISSQPQTEVLQSSQSSWLSLSSSLFVSSAISVIAFSMHSHTLATSPSVKTL